MRKISVILILLLSICCYAFATEIITAEITGTGLLQGCNSLAKALENQELTKEDYSNVLFWSGYLAGFLDTMPAAGTTFYCLPEGGLSYGQLAMVVQKYLRNNPEFLDKEPAAIILLALGKAFPCKR